LSDPDARDGRVRAHEFDENVSTRLPGRTAEIIKTCC
jgi:hypothetical protein